MSTSANYERDRTLLINVVKSLQQVSEGTNSRIKKTSDKRAKSPKIPSRGRSSAGASGPIISHPVMTKGKVGKQDILSDTSSESTASRTPNGVRVVMYRS